MMIKHEKLNELLHSFDLLLTLHISLCAHPVFKHIYVFLLNHWRFFLNIN